MIYTVKSLIREVKQNLRDKNEDEDLIIKMSLDRQVFYIGRGDDIVSELLDMYVEIYWYEEGVLNIKWKKTS